MRRQRQLNDNSRDLWRARETYRTIDQLLLARVSWKPDAFVLDANRVTSLSLQSHVQLALGFVSHNYIAQARLIVQLWLKNFNVFLDSALNVFANVVRDLLAINYFMLIRLDESLALLAVSSQR